MKDAMTVTTSTEIAELFEPICEHSSAYADSVFYYFRDQAALNQAKLLCLIHGFEVHDVAPLPKIYRIHVRHQNDPIRRPDYHARHNTD